MNRRRILLLCTCAVAVFMVGVMYYSYDREAQYNLVSILSMTARKSKTLLPAAISRSLVLPYPYTSVIESLGKGLGQHESPKVWDVSQSPSFDEDLDHLELLPIPFLRNMKNPCWIESMPQNGEPRQTNILTTIFRELEKFPAKSETEYREMRATTGVTWRLRCLPYYYIIGVSKCGSTDLNAIVSKHPRVVAPPRKEMTYWNRIRYTTTQPFLKSKLQAKLKLLESRPTWPFNQYLDVYDFNAISIGRDYLDSKANKSLPYFDKITGDATPNYVWDFDGWRKVAANRGLDEPKYILANLIKHVTPMARIILIIRDPIKRLWSEYMFFQASKPKSPQLFHSLIVEAIKTWNECLAKRSMKYCAYDQSTNSKNMPVRLRVSLYYVFIKDWLEVFERGQFLLVRLEDYAANRTATANQIFDFLHLEPMKMDLDEAKVRNSNKKGKQFQMLKVTEKLLVEFFKPWNEKLETLMNDERFNYNS